MKDSTRYNYEKRIARDIRKIWALYDRRSQTGRLRYLLLQWGKKIAKYEQKLLAIKYCEGENQSTHPDTLAALETRSKLVAETIQNTTRKRLENDKDLTRSDIETPGRAEMIAITETTFFIWLAVSEIKKRCSNTLMVWVTSDDERVCPVCGPLHLKPNVGKAWRGLTPPAHPGCRCNVKLMRK